MHAQWDNKLFASVATRILKEVLPERSEYTLFEPLLEIKPCHKDEGVYERTDKLEGLTSLRGKKYEPLEEYVDKLILHKNPEYAFFKVSIKNFDDVVFDGCFETEDLFRAGLDQAMQPLMKSDKLSGYGAPFYYEIKPAEKAETTVLITLSPAFLWSNSIQSENVFEIPKLEKNRERIIFKKVSAESIPLVRESQFENTQALGHRGTEQNGRVVIHRDVYKSLVSDIELSDKEENGGYLLGHVYRQAGSPDSEEDPDFRWTLEITEVFKSKDTFGNSVLLMFTHDSWSEVKLKIDQEHPDKKLVSWFHTHLFKGSDSFGLSGLDQELHANFFSKPWQVALLLNIDKTGERELRCFQQNSTRTKLVESTYEVIK